MKKSPRDDSIGAQMAIALQLMKKANNDAIAASRYKITMEQLAVLEMLDFQGDMNMTELSHAVWKQNANITRIIDILENRKLVERKAVPGDRRANLVSITKEGRGLFKDVIPIVLEVIKDAVSCLDKEEEVITLNALKKIVAHFSQN